MMVELNCLIYLVHTFVPVVVLKTMDFVKVVQCEWNAIEVLAANFTGETLWVETLSSRPQDLKK